MLKHSVVLKFNNVEKLKTMWKMLKTPNGETAEVPKVATQPLKIRRLNDKIKKEVDHHGN